MMSGKIDGMNGQGTTQLIRFSGDGSVQPSVLTSQLGLRTRFCFETFSYYSRRTVDAVR